MSEICITISDIVHSGVSEKCRHISDNKELASIVWLSPLEPRSDCHWQLSALLGSLAVVLDCAWPLSGKPSTDWHAVGREIFAEAVSIRTVKGSRTIPQLVARLRQRFEAVGLDDITVQNHDATQAVIIRRPATGKATQTGAVNDTSTLPN